MASRIMHLAVSEKVAKHFELDLGRFNYGNLLPDAHESTREAKAVSHFRIRREAYENSKALDYQYFDFDRFLSKYKSKIHDDLYLGYYCHLITDEIWIQDVYIKYMRDEHRKKRIDQEENYYHDFAKLNQIIIEKYDLKMNVEMGSFQTDEIDEEKISDIMKGLEQDFKVDYDDLTLLLFDEGDIMNFVDETSSRIIMEIEMRGLR